MKSVVVLIGVLYVAMFAPLMLVAPVKAELPTYVNFDPVSDGYYYHSWYGLLYAGSEGQYPFYQTLTWKTFQQVLAYHNDRRYIAQYMQEWSAVGSVSSWRQIGCLIKPYWSNSYVLYFGQYQPTEGTYSDTGTNTFSVSVGAGSLSFGLSLGGGWFNPYQISTDHYYGWFKWVHTLTFWGWQAWIFGSGGTLKWSVIFDTKRYTATLGIYGDVTFPIGGNRGNYVHTWTWSNIYTYRP